MFYEKPEFEIITINLLGNVCACASDDDNPWAG